MIDGAHLSTPLADSLANVAFVMSACWTDPRYRHSRAPEGILDQEVDKSSLLLFNTLREADPGGQYFSPSPFTIVPGRHGPGPALITRQAPQFICDLIRTVQKIVPSLILFNISKAGDRADFFEPRVSRVAWDRWKLGRRPGAVELIDALGDIFARLSQGQAIAFGRHPTVKDSCQALGFLHRTFKQSIEKLFVNPPASADEFTPSVSDVVNDLYNIGASGYAKVTMDPQHYSDARSIVREEANRVVREALLKARGAWEDIGRDRDWRKLAPKSRALYQLGVALRAGHRRATQTGRESAHRPVDELVVADTAWRAERVTESTSIPVDELSNGFYCGRTKN